METTTFEVSGMHCKSCALKITLKLEELAGVKSSEPNPDTNMVEVTYDPAVVGLDQIKAAVTEEGFPAVA